MLTAFLWALGVVFLFLACVYGRDLYRLFKQHKSRR